MKELLSKWRNFLWRHDFIITFVIAFAVLSGFPIFISGIELRQGAVLVDPVLKYLTPTDLSLELFIGLHFCIVVFFGHILNDPQKIMKAVQAYSLMVAIRMLVMWLTPLDPPEGIIPLRDPITEFASAKVMTRDLFFSGHTSTIFLIFLCTTNIWLRSFFFIMFLAIAMGVLFQHVHYTIDVVSAPVFAYFSNSIARKL
jgi:hypothetical protein